MNLHEDINRIKEVMGLDRKPEVVRKGELTNKYGEEITMILFDDGEVNFKHTDYGNEFLPLRSLLRKDSEGNSMFMVVLNQEEKDFVNNFLRDTKYQNESYNPTITESRDIFFKRRQEEFLEDVLNSFDWMDVEESNSVEEYVEDILRHSIDSFFGYNNILVTSEEIAELLPPALKILRSKEQLYKQIKGYWYRNNSTSRINESNEINRVKRRMDALLDYIEHSYDWLSPRNFRDFDHFLKRVVFMVTRDFVHDEIGGEYEDQLKIREELGPKILELIKKHSIHDEIYDHYISNQ
jgi:hypothetical protein